MFAELPPAASWRFRGAVDGFEVVFPQRRSLQGHTSAVEDGFAYAVSYEIDVDEDWRTRRAHITLQTATGRRARTVSSDGDGRWTIDGVGAPHLDGLVDVDLEASACTNTLPIHRLEMAQGETIEVPAVYVRAHDLSVTRLSQTYRRLDGHRYDYTADYGGFHAVLTYDSAGLIVDYPGIATRFS
jgi:hypothetical protein